eukprot:6182431-Pleurochrysis_carterae.AAC.4
MMRSDLGYSSSLIEAMHRRPGHFIRCFIARHQIKQATRIALHEQLFLSWSHLMSLLLLECIYLLEEPVNSCISSDKVPKNIRPCTHDPTNAQWRSGTQNAAPHVRAYACMLAHLACKSMCTSKHFSKVLARMLASGMHLSGGVWLAERLVKMRGWNRLRAS